MPSWGTGQDAAAPPAQASSTGFETSPSGGTFVQPKPFEASPGGTQQSSAVAGGALEDDNESCVVCMSAAVKAGFLHGSRLVTQEASCIEPAVCVQTHIWCACVRMCACMCLDACTSTKPHAFGFLRLGCSSTLLQHLTVAPYLLYLGVIMLYTHQLTCIWASGRLHQLLLTQGCCA